MRKTFPTLWRSGLAVLFVAAGFAAQAQHAPKGGAPQRRAAALGIDAAFSPNGDLWVVGLNAQSQLFVQTSHDEGRSWAPPRVIDNAGEAIAADGENRPKIAFGQQGRVVIATTQPLTKPYTGNIRMLRSEDGGRSFSAPFTVHSDRQLITHRFESVAFDAKGTLHTVWVDKRDLERASPGSYRGAAIYRNESTDGGKIFGPDIKLADHTCECCRIALAHTPEGGMVAMWRHVFEPNQRDHAFAALGAASEPTRATIDRWAIDACPHHGPGLASDGAQGYHAVWFGERAGEMRVRYGRLAPDGTPRGPVLALPDERAEHADVQSAGPHVAIVWRSFDGQATLWRAWVSHDHGGSFELRELGRSGDENDHPRLARRGGQIFALWRTTQGVRVERLVP